MTQKEKLIKAFMALTSIKHSIENLNNEANDYDMSFHKSYVRDIKSECDKTLKLLK